MKELAILLLGGALAILCTGCHRAYYKQYESTSEGLFVFWREYAPVSNQAGVCAEVYRLSNGKWEGENHRMDAPWDAETGSHVGFAKFDTEYQAEAWGDKTCPN